MKHPKPEFLPLGFEFPEPHMERKAMQQPDMAFTGSEFPEPGMQPAATRAFAETQPMPKIGFKSTDWIAEPGYDEPDLPEDGSKRQIGIRILAAWGCIVVLAVSLYIASLHGAL